MRGALDFRRRSATACVMRSGPSAFARHVASKTSGEVSRILVPSSRSTAALFTRMSRVPKRLRTALATDAIDSGSVTSRAIGIARGPIADAADLADDSLRPVTIAV
jgi:hypothetical protein